MAFDRFADIPFRLFERTGCDAARESPDLPEVLTGGTDLTDTQEQAVDCLAEDLTGRIARGEALPAPAKLKWGQHPVSVPLYAAPKLALYLALSPCLRQGFGV